MKVWKTVVILWADPFFSPLPDYIADWTGYDIKTEPHNQSLNRLTELSCCHEGADPMTRLGAGDVRRVWALLEGLDNTREGLSGDKERGRG